MSKIKLFHFHNGSGGGVLSVIKNLLKYSSNPAIENHVIFTINKDRIPEYEMPVLEGAVSRQLFYYSPKWNFYYTCKQLAKLLPDEKAVVVAHDWLELGMMSNLGLQNPAVQMVHGNYAYYYGMAQRHKGAVDRFICISPVIYKQLCAILPGRENDIYYCRFPVPHIKPLEKYNEILKMFYCVRSLNDENKQFVLLPRIGAILQAANVNVHWTIVGSGIDKGDVGKLMNDSQNLSLFPSLTNEEILNLLPQYNLFILPSLKEGFPVALVEAMKAGLVPLVTNWDKATEELVVQGETGFYFESGDAGGYAKAIQLLNANRAILKKMGDAGRQKANELFNPGKNTQITEVVFVESFNGVRCNKKSFKAYGSRLDKPDLPNFITTALRKFTL